MILHVGERVYWGAPEVIYLEGTVRTFDEAAQTVVVHVERTTPHSAHLIGSDVPFSADGLRPLPGDSPPGITGEYSSERLAAPVMSDDEKIRAAAAAAIHQQYGYTLSEQQEQELIEQVRQALDGDFTIRTHIIASMDKILRREL
jgi:hypothetical protein